MAIKRNMQSRRTLFVYANQMKKCPSSRNAMPLQCHKCKKQFPACQWGWLLSTSRNQHAAKNRHPSQCSTSKETHEAIGSWEAQILHNLSISFFRFILMFHVFPFSLGSKGGASTMEEVFTSSFFPLSDLQYPRCL